MLTYLAVFVIACVTTLILLPLTGAVISRLRAGRLSIRFWPVPRTGGLAIYGGFLVAVAYAWLRGAITTESSALLQGVLIGGGMVALTGLWSDVRGDSILSMLLWQFVAAAVAMGYGVQAGFLPGRGLGLALTFLYLVGCASAVNRLGGTNGLVGGVSLVAALSLGLIAALRGNGLVGALAVALGGSVLGFLPSNFPSARVSEGDMGSLFLGFSLASLAVLLADRPHDPLCFVVPPVVLGVPVFGLALALMRRLWQRDGLFSRDRDYPFDLLARQWGGRRLAGRAAAVSLFLGGAAVIATWAQGWWGVALVAVAVGIVLWAARASGVLAGLASSVSSDAPSILPDASSVSSDASSLSSDPLAPQGARRRLAGLAAQVRRRYALPVLFDLATVVAAFYLALGLRFSGELAGDLANLVRYAGLLANLILFVACVFVTSGAVFGLYSRIWRYASGQEVVSILGAGGLGTLVVLIVDLLWTAGRPIPLSVVLMGGLLSTVSLTALRYRQRLLTGLLWRLGLEADTNRQRTLIVGAGEEGQLLARRMQHRDGHYVPVGFVDDDLEKVGLQVHGVPVLGAIDRIPDLVARHRAGMVVIAMPGVGRKRLNEIFDICQESSARIQVLPDVMAHLAGTNGTKALRDLTIEDLLGRPPRAVDEAACRSLVAGKVVLVTGAAGSIGSELCRQVALYAPARVLALDQDETGLYNLGLDLGSDVPLDLLIGDVSDRERLEAIWRQHRPAVVFHCAAYKHVPMLEQCPAEAVKTNVLGTLVPAALSQEWGTDHFIFVSTDKAACPINVLGASKRVGELLMLAMQDSGHDSTRFSVVRFGNVLGSRGSVVPTFSRQIERGGPVTITHPHMERFFMSVQEAASLVIQAGAYTTGGDLFVLDMGEEVRIEEVARKVIRLQGLRVGRDIEIAVTGVRPGEKLSEILSCPVCEVLEPTQHGSILHVQNHHDLPLGDLASQVGRMIDLAKQGTGDSGELRTLLFDAARLPCPADCDRPECA
jgi:FlaA1/EpsC-like NDP-sugar epimerase/UDP-N-acetylmuramyl pentapeptide phosphotransferase/UDP-N-acetylglucosamine-1-phosphate transferase